MRDIRLTATSYIVLGLLDRAGTATPYELKQTVANGVGNFWNLHHAQLYTEPERLAAAGYLTEEREDGGRRRKHYSLTKQGREALGEWLSEPTAELTELRDPGLLRLFFGGDPAELATVQLDAHRRKLAEYEEIAAQVTDAWPEGPRLTLESGIGHEREWIRYWERIARG